VLFRKEGPDIYVLVAAQSWPQRLKPNISIARFRHG
jgi:hypothetical protein